MMIKSKRVRNFRALPLLLLLGLLGCIGGEHSNEKRASPLVEGNFESPPSGIELIDPRDKVNYNPTPILRIKGVLPGDEILLFSDENCSHQLASKKAEDTHVFIRTSLLTPGEYNFRAKRIHQGRVSSCSEAGLVYEVIDFYLRHFGHTITDDHRLRLSWETHPQAVAYELYEIGEDSYASLVATMPPWATEYTSGPLLLGKFYRYRLRARNEVGVYSQNSLNAHFSIDGNYTPAPVHFYLSEETPSPGFISNPKIVVEDVALSFDGVKDTIQFFSNAACTSPMTAEIEVNEIPFVHEMPFVFPFTATRIYTKRTHRGIPSDCSKDFIYYVMERDFMGINFQGISHYSSFQRRPIMQVMGVRNDYTVRAYLADSTCAQDNKIGKAVAVDNMASLALNELPIGTNHFYLQVENKGGTLSECRLAQFGMTNNYTTMTFSGLLPTYQATDHSVELSWPGDHQIHIEEYRLYKDGFFHKSIPSSETSITVTNLMANRTYSFWLNAVDKNGVEGESPTHLAVTTGSAPQAPVGIARISPVLGEDLGFARELDIEVSGVGEGYFAAIYPTSDCTGPYMAMAQAQGDSVIVSVELVNPGFHELYARVISPTGNSSPCFDADFAFYTLRADPPVAELATPSWSAPWYLKTPSYQVNFDFLTGDHLSIYSDGECTQPKGTELLTLDASDSQVMVSELITDRNYRFFIQVEDQYGHKSHCIGPSENYMANGAPSALALSDSTFSPSYHNNPKFSLSGVPAGSDVRLYLEDSIDGKCHPSHLVGEYLNAQSSVVSLELHTPLSTSGEHVFHAIYCNNQQPSDCSDCSEVSVSYQLLIDTPLQLSMANPAASIGFESKPSLLIQGGADHFVGQKVSLYSDSACTSELATGNLNQLKLSLLKLETSLSVGHHQFYGAAFDQYGAKSSCAGPLSYEVRDSNLTLSFANTDLSSGEKDYKRDFDFSIGPALPSDTAVIYDSANCSGTPLVEGGSFSGGTIILSLGEEEEELETPKFYQFSARLKNSQGALSSCTQNFLSYTLHPGVTQLSRVSPLASEAPDNKPIIRAHGQLENDLIRIYANADCSGEAIGGPVLSDESQEVMVSLELAGVGSYRFYAQAESVRGYNSFCSNFYLNYELLPYIELLSDRPLVVSDFIADSVLPVEDGLVPVDDPLEYAPIIGKIENMGAAGHFAPSAPIENILNLVPVGQSSMEITHDASETFSALLEVFAYIPGTGNMECEFNFPFQSMACLEDNEGEFSASLDAGDFFNAGLKASVKRTGEDNVFESNQLQVQKLQVKLISNTRIDEELSDFDATVLLYPFGDYLFFLGQRGALGRKKLYSYHLPSHTFTQVSNTRNDNDEEDLVIGMMGLGGHLYFQAWQNGVVGHLMRYRGSMDHEIEKISDLELLAHDAHAKLGDKVYFRAIHPTSPPNRHLYSYDPNTHEIAQISRTANGGNDDPSSFYQFGDKLFFSATNHLGGRKLYHFSEEEGVVQVSNTAQNQASDDGIKILGHSHNGDLYFAGINSQGGEKLYRYSPTSTPALRQITNTRQDFALNDDVAGFAEIGAYIYFSARNENNNRKLYRYNKNSHLIQQITDFRTEDNVDHIFAHENLLFFSANRPGDLGGEKLFVFDTLTGVIRQVSNTRDDQGLGDHMSGLISYGGKLYFIARNSHDQNKLYQYDPQTHLVAQVSNTRENNNQADNPLGLIVHQNYLFFISRNVHNATKLYKLCDPDAGCEIEN